MIFDQAFVRDFFNMPKAAAKPMEKCATCRYWDGPVNRCHRHAPVAVGDTYESQRIWPTTHPADWCGDWEPK